MSEATQDVPAPRSEIAHRYLDAIVTVADNVLRNAPGHNGSVVSAVFRLPRSSDGPIYELVELGAFVSFIAGGQRWIYTLDVKHGEVLFETTAGLSEEAASDFFSLFPHVSYLCGHPPSRHHLTDGKAAPVDSTLLQDQGIAFLQ